MSDNAPASLIVVYRCDTHGAVASLELWHDDALPPDHAVIAAYEEHIA